ncbi:hypothetical protein F4678DRAFT_452666 [Xylaria arbuscula]|nr:hypothetical protein F4678DRAFT_452666 [Xylaria arbuscula]
MFGDFVLPRSRAYSPRSGKAENIPGLDPATPIWLQYADSDEVEIELTPENNFTPPTIKKHKSQSAKGRRPIRRPPGDLGSVNMAQADDNPYGPHVGVRQGYQPSLAQQTHSHEDKNPNVTSDGKLPETNDTGQQTYHRRSKAGGMIPIATDLLESHLGKPDTSYAYERPPRDDRVSDLHNIFKECVPTKERLANLRNGWTDRKFLHLRLLYCQPFNIVLLEREQLVMKSHQDLEELLLNEKLESFLNQVWLSWPESFGILKSREDVPYCFQWQPNESQLDDGTNFLSRVAVVNEERQPINNLISPGTPVVFSFPRDNMLWQVMPKVGSSVLTMRTIAFLENLFAPTHGVGSPLSYGSLSDWFSIQTTTPGLRSTGSFGMGNWFCIQINMRACIPDEKDLRNKHFKRSWGISPKGVGLPLNRQTARIPDLSLDRHLTAVEYLLSVSMVLRKVTTNAASCVKYDIVSWLDYETDFEKSIDREIIFPVLSRKVNIDLGLEDCGVGGEAVIQFLMALAKSIDHWKHCWDNMIDKVDDIISIQLQDTLDQKRWNSLMFDDSLQLSEQYFTILQLLRIWQNWIGEAERSIHNLGEELIQKCEFWKAWQQQHAQKDLSQWPLDMAKLRHNIKCLQNFFGTRASPIRERIKIKKDEVTSLQDALSSSSSLRETLKAKTLNLYIGVFTTVTVFFTPLGFTATVWTIPFLQTNSSDPTPKGFMESFVVVPVLTYLLSGCIILYFWATSSRHQGTIFSPRRFITRIGRNVLVLRIIERIRRIVELVNMKLIYRLVSRRNKEHSMV